MRKSDNTGLFDIYITELKVLLLMEGDEVHHAAKRHKSTRIPESGT